MKKILLSRLRDSNTSRKDFREATFQLGTILACEAAEQLLHKKSTIRTPVAETEGVSLQNPVILVPILRSGLALLPSFTKIFPEAKVGMIGMYRDEKTALPHLYYQNFPRISQDDDVLLLEPMIATGGSLSQALDILIHEKKIAEEKIIICGVVAAPEGIEAVRKYSSKVRLLFAQKDEKLNAKKFIVPGLGDFGDRYFGTE